MGIQSIQATRWRRFGHEALLQVVVVAAWLTSFAAAGLLEYAPNASLWFPPAGITFAAVLILGLRILPVLWLGCMLVTVLSNHIHQLGLTWPSLVLAGLAFGMTHTLAYGAVALVLRRGASDASPVTTLSQVSWFLLAGAASAGLSSLFGGLSLAWSGMTEMHAVPNLIAPWWIGDYAGLVTIAPLFGLLLSRVADKLGGDTPQGLRRLMGAAPWRDLFPRAAGKLGALMGLTVLVLLTAAAFPGQDALLFLLFVCLIVQLWIVHTESELASLIGILAFGTMLALAAGMMGLAGQALMLQFVVISLAVSSYLGLAVPALYRDNHRMRQLLTHDSLTGALSRSYFEAAASEGIRKAGQRGLPACLVMIDMDGLKPINDDYGHAAGDRALIGLAEVCGRNLAPGQLLGRLSGDEFALFLIDCRQQEAARVVNAIQNELSAGPAMANGETLSASFGIAELDPARLDYKTLLGRADQAMYTDKQQKVRRSPDNLPARSATIARMR